LFSSSGSSKASAILSGEGLKEEIKRTAVETNCSTETPNLPSYFRLSSEVVSPHQLPLVGLLLCSESTAQRGMPRYNYHDEGCFPSSMVNSCRNAMLIFKQRFSESFGDPFGGGAQGRNKRTAAETNCVN
jgi:hypothetical protein